ncbi:MAG: polysaccharide biosynthesis protein [Ruminococcus sp.]
MLIGSVRDTRKINDVFETYKPDIVYHAAAHKHVPLMETSPCEAIKNNVMGTYKTATCSSEKWLSAFRTDQYR